MKFIQVIKIDQPKLFPMLAELKERASFITRSNEEDAVLLIIQQLLALQIEQA